MVSDVKILYNEISVILEDLFREADWRCEGGFNTSDTKFALQVREILRELTAALSELAIEHETDIDNVNNEINELEYSLDEAQKKLNQIEAWVIKQQQLSKILDIIRHGDNE